MLEWPRGMRSADAVVAGLPPQVQGIYNVGTGQETTVNEIFGYLRKLTKSECREIHGPAKKGEQFRSSLNASRLQEAIGWEPTVSLPDGLMQTVQFFRGKS